MKPWLLSDAWWRVVWSRWWRSIVYVLLLAGMLALFVLVCIPLLRGIWASAVWW